MSGKADGSIWYKVWHWCLMRCLDLFYKRIEVSGAENIPHGRAVIFASNHTNALMDPLVIAYHSGRQHYFMTRGDVFEKKFLERIFRSWRMLPIFRMKDGIKSLAKNEEIMNFVIDRLKHDHSIIIFPEGSHYWERSVQPLKKGLVRMAFDVLEQRPDADLSVVPVGLYFNNLVNVNQDVLVSFGEPISLSDFPQEENQAKTYQKFNKELRVAMRELVIDIEPDDFYQAKDEWRLKLEKQLRHLKVKESFDLQRRFIKTLERAIEKDAKIIQSSSLEVLLSHDAFAELGAELKNRLQNKPKRNPLIQVLKWPLYVLAWIQYLPVLLIGKKLLSGIKDRTFHSSVKFGLGMILQAIMSLVYAFILLAVFDSWFVFLFYLLSVPIWGALLAEFNSRKEFYPY